MAMTWDVVVGPSAPIAWVDRFFYNKDDPDESFLISSV